MGWFSSTKAQLGVGSQPRQFRPQRSSSNLIDLAGAFGEANPATLTDTPRTVGYVPAMAEPISGKARTVANGWIDQRWQTKGMSTLYIDQVQLQPDPAVRGIVASAINHSRYAPFFHQRFGWWLYANWDPIFRFANTAMDMRWAVGHIAPLSAAQPGNIPGTARMGPYAWPLRNAYLIPRFSTEPSTVVPVSGR